MVEEMLPAVKDQINRFLLIFPTGTDVQYGFWLDRLLFHELMIH